MSINGSNETGQRCYQERICKVTSDTGERGGVNLIRPLLQGCQLTGLMETLHQGDDQHNHTHQYHHCKFGYFMHFILFVFCVNLSKKVEIEHHCGCDKPPPASLLAILAFLYFVILCRFCILLSVMQIKREHRSFSGHILHFGDPWRKIDKYPAHP